MEEEESGVISSQPHPNYMYQHPTPKTGDMAQTPGRTPHDHFLNVTPSTYRGTKQLISRGFRVPGSDG